MEFRADQLMQKAEGKAYAIASLDIFNMDIVNACFAAASANHTDIALACDCMHADPQEIHHWLAHYAAQYPNVSYASIARNVVSFEQAMQTLCAGYRTIVLDEKYQDTHSVQEIREIVRIAHAADAACAVCVRLPADFNIQNMQVLAEQTGVDILYVALPKNMPEDQLSEAAAAIASLRQSTHVLLASKKGDPAQVDEMRILLRAGLRLFDLHCAVDTAVKAQKSQTFLNNESSPDLFLSMIKDMADTAAQTFVKASVVLNSNRRTF